MIEGLSVPVSYALAVGVVLCFFVPVISNNSLDAFAQEPSGNASFNAGIDIFGDSRFKTQASTFVRGDTAYFNGWSNAFTTDGRSGLIVTPHSNFTIDIIDPENNVIFHQELTADDQGNARFTLPITSDFVFGIYDVRYAVEKEGYKTISPSSPDPDVHYSPVRFFVTWTEDDIVDISDRYRLEIIELVPDTEPFQFGSYFNIKATLCPTPLSLVPNHGFVDATSGEILLNSQGPAIVVNAELKPLDEQESEAGHIVTTFLRDTTTFLREDWCSKPFELQTGMLRASGKWSMTATAHWLQKNDTQHVFQAVSNTLMFDVEETLYRSTDVKRINAEPGMYESIVPLEWTSDGRSILVGYNNAGEGTRRLGFYSLSNNTITDVGAPFVDNEDYYLDSFTTKLSPSGDRIIQLVGSDLYSYDVQKKEVTRLTNSGTILSFDIAFDGRLLYNSNGDFMISDSDATNSTVIFSPGDENIYAVDISPDGNKLLYRKTLAAEYGWADRVLAYYDLEEKKENVIPNVHIGCGEEPKWAPNGFHVAFHESSCSRAGPGGTLRITDLNGSFQEYIVPSSNDNPSHFIFSPNGNSIMIAFSSYGTGGTVDQMGGPANFYIMTLARPMPEFGSYIIAILVAGSLASTIVVAKKLGRFGFKKYE